MRQSRRSDWTPRSTGQVVKKVLVKRSPGLANTLNIRYNHPIGNTRCGNPTLSSTLLILLDTGANPPSLSLSQIERRKLSKNPLIYRHKRYSPIIDSTLQMTSKGRKERARQRTFMMSTTTMADRQTFEMFLDSVPSILKR